MLQSSFRPEFLNRIDETIVFHSLNHEHIRRIIDIQLERLRENLKERKISLELSDEAKALLARDGYDPAFGARPLKRAIQKHILDGLATAILSGAVKDGSNVRATVESSDSGRIKFETVSNGR